LGVVWLTIDALASGEGTELHAGEVEVKATTACAAVGRGVAGVA
jgi:hypothetical protein